LAIILILYIDFIGFLIFNFFFISVLVILAFQLILSQVSCQDNVTNLCLNVRFKDSRVAHLLHKHFVILVETFFTPW